MNKVEELIKRVRLTPEERRTAVEGVWRKHDELSDSEFWGRLYRVVAEAQLNKVLNDSDLALIDRDEMVATASTIIGTESERNYWTAGFRARGEICRKTYIHLVEALKE